jgi:hypothetical protein
LRRPNQPVSGFGVAARTTRSLLVVGIHRARDVGGAHLAAADRRHHLLDRGAREPRQRALQLLVGVVLLGALEQPLDDAPPSSTYCVRTAARVARRIAARALPVTTTTPTPPAARPAPSRSDLDLVAVRQLGDQRRDLAVDLAPTALLPTSVCTA